MPQVAKEQYYSFEKGKYGGPCGAIFPFFRELNGLSALGQDYLDYVPAGFLKCRGQILSADQYPNLARILGVGANCIYKKAGTVLLEKEDDGTGGTFQLPDLGSKYLVASSQGGTYQNDTALNPSTNLTVKRAGVGVTLEAVSNKVDFSYSGEFKLPGRTLNLSGNIQAKSPASSTPEATLSIGNFLGHGHNSTFKISRQINYRNDGINGATWKQYFYYCSKAQNSDAGCKADANVGVQHKGVEVTSEGTDTATKHKHYGVYPSKDSETKSASVGDMTMDAGPLVTSVTVNTVNTYKMDNIAPKFILCEYLIKY